MWLLRMVVAGTHEKGPTVCILRIEWKNHWADVWGEGGKVLPTTPTLGEVLSKQGWLRFMGERNIVGWSKLLHGASG